MLVWRRARPGILVQNRPILDLFGEPTRCSKVSAVMGCSGAANDSIIRLGKKSMARKYRDLDCCEILRFGDGAQ